MSFGTEGSLTDRLEEINFLESELKKGRAWIVKHKQKLKSEKQQFEKDRLEYKQLIKTKLKQDEKTLLDRERVILKKEKQLQDRGNSLERTALELGKEIDDLKTQRNCFGKEKEQFEEEKRKFKHEYQQNQRAHSKLIGFCDALKENEHTLASRELELQTEKQNLNLEKRENSLYYKTLFSETDHAAGRVRLDVEREQLKQQLSEMKHKEQKLKALDKKIKTEQESLQKQKKESENNEKIFSEKQRKFEVEKGILEEKRKEFLFYEGKRNKQNSQHKEVLEHLEKAIEENENSKTNREKIKLKFETLGQIFDQEKLAFEQKKNSFNEECTKFLLEKQEHVEHVNKAVLQIRNDKIRVNQKIQDLKQAKLKLRQGEEILRQKEELHSLQVSSIVHKNSYINEEEEENQLQAKLSAAQEEIASWEKKYKELTVTKNFVDVHRKYWSEKKGTSGPLSYESLFGSPQRSLEEKEKHLNQMKDEIASKMKIIQEKERKLNKKEEKFIVERKQSSELQKNQKCLELQKLDFENKTEELQGLKKALLHMLQKASKGETDELLKSPRDPCKTADSRLKSSKTPLLHQIIKNHTFTKGEIEFCEKTDCDPAIYSELVH